MTRINYKKQHGFFTSDLTITVVWAVLMIFSLVLTLLFTVTLIEGIKEANTKSTLKKSKKANKDPMAEIHLFGQQNQYLNYVEILDNEQNSYLIISLPADEILKNLKGLNISEGYLELIQRAGNFSKVKLKSWGTSPKDNVESIKNSKEIPGSYLSINYAYPSPNYLFKGMTSILLFIAVVLSILKSIKKIKQKKKDENVYVHVENKATQPKTIKDTIDQAQTKQLADLTNKGENVKEIDESIFRAYDIRGIVDESLTVDAVKLIGQSIGTENIKRGKKDIVVARDGRLSGPKLLTALIEDQHWCSSNRCFIFCNSPPGYWFRRDANGQSQSTQLQWLKDHAQWRNLSWRHD